MDPSDKARQEKLQADLQALESLRTAKKGLQEDIRNKLVALDIDNLCRRVTPAKADSAKRQSAMQRTGSAPSLQGTRKKEMGSSFGKSTDFGGMGDAHSSMDGSTRAPSTAKPPSP